MIHHHEFGSSGSAVHEIFGVDEGETIIASPLHNVEAAIFSRPSPEAHIDDSRLFSSSEQAPRADIEMDQAVHEKPRFEEREEPHHSLYQLSDQETRTTVALDLTLALGLGDDEQEEAAPLPITAASPARLENLLLQVEGRLEERMKKFKAEILEEVWDMENRLQALLVKNSEEEDKSFSKKDVKEMVTELDLKVQKWSKRTVDVSTRLSRIEPVVRSLPNDLEKINEELRTHVTEEVTNFCHQTLALVSEEIHSLKSTLAPSHPSPPSPSG